VAWGGGGRSGSSQQSSKVYANKNIFPLET